ncbi:MAG: hypothetical protein QUU85_09880, partial [Candidatus Eisenbacteria bacterium]|nr:hypothetical protein [Candidatus Eisenbacteria bacterium]
GAVLPERRGSRGIFGDSHKRLLVLLAKGSRSAELLSREAGRSEREVLASLAKLELLGAVRRAPGMRFALRRVPEPA